MTVSPDTGPNNKRPEDESASANSDPSQHDTHEDWASRLSLQTNATITDKLIVTEGLYILKVTPDEPMSFLPGQHTVITLDVGDAESASSESAQTTVKGYFSIASSPVTPESLEFLVNTRNESELSLKLDVLTAGDRILVDPNIRGNLHLHAGEGFREVSPDRNLIMIATGTGIAPMMSILRSEETWTDGRSITLIHGIRGIDDSAYLPELLQLERTRDFTYVPSLTRQDTDSSTLSGRISLNSIQAATDLDTDSDCILICGHFDLVGQLKEEFCNLGFSDDLDSGDERTLITE